MAVNVSYSDLVANTRAKPAVLNQVGVSGGRVRRMVDYFSTDAVDVDTAADVIVLARMPSASRPMSIKVWNTALDAVADLAVDLGIYNPAGVVQDVDAFASAYTGLQAAVTTPAELMFEAGAAPALLIGKRLWEWGLYSADPLGVLDIAFTLTTAAATAAAGSIGFEILYTVD